MMRKKCLQVLSFIILLGACPAFCADMNDLSFCVSDPIILSSHRFTIWLWTESLRNSPIPARRFLKIYKNGRDLKLKDCSWPKGFIADGDWMLEYEIGMDPLKLGPFIKKCALKEKKVLMLDEHN